MRTLCATAFRPYKPIDSESDALGRVKRVMYSCFGAPEDGNKKKQGAAGGAIGNANANRPMRREKATNDQVQWGRRVLCSAHFPLLILSVFRNG
ncbi:BQ5605_C004g03048 [Microbotryum silenes-dioicae]|uniref:BQ5605_C004g03048 protein n=1 Tax=Microbotryum silenes-dioicae TaxID=796604 RepID=A0A2X0ME46_9BASI|nr:BQ5605_C004g03048 [Microbotryum silenes-dioicae]